MSFSADVHLELYSFVDNSDFCDFQTVLMTFFVMILICFTVFFHVFFLFNDFFIILEYIDFFIIFRKILFLNAMYVNLLNIYSIKSYNFLCEYFSHVIQFISFLSFLQISFSFIFIVYIHSAHIILTSNSVKTVVQCCCNCFFLIIARSLALLTKMFRFFTVIAFLYLFEC